MMKAMILAAGLGTRLSPLTENKPKALVELNGKPLLVHTIEKLYRAGIREIVINVHHFSGQVIRFLDGLSFKDLKLHISDESASLLDTGGGILHARPYLDGNEPFIVHNTDVISPVDLTSLAREHARNSGLGTLAVCERRSSRYLLFGEDNILCGWEDTRSGEKIIARKSENYRRLAFSGIHILDPSYFRLVKQRGRFSIIEAYLDLAATKEIFAFEHSPEGFFDLGDLRKLQSAEQFLINLSL